MRTSKKNWLLVVALLIILGILFYAGCRYNKLSNQFATYIKTSEDTIRHWKDAYGREHATKKTEILPEAVFRNSNDSEVVELRKEIKKSKNLVSYLRATINSFDTFRT